MEEFLKNLFGHVSPLVGYLVLFVSAIIENIFPPIPGDTVTVLGAYLITTGFLGFWGVYLSTTLGSVAGFFLMYLVGLRFGKSFLKSKLRRRYFQDARIEKVEGWFGRYGYGIIAANRFLSGTRSVISIFAGIFRLNWLRVVVLATISALIWNGALIYAGYQLGMNWGKISALLGQYNKIVLLLTIVFIIFLVIRWRRKKRQMSNVNSKMVNNNHTVPVKNTELKDTSDRKPDLTKD